MFNKLKNAIYGSSTGDFLDHLIADQPPVRPLTRSVSFHDRSPSVTNNNSRTTPNNSIPVSKSQLFRQNRTSSQNNGSSTNQHHDKNGYNHGDRRYSDDSSKKQKYNYTRPSFLQLKTDDEIIVSADHQIRPIMLPRDAERLPWRTGYAECINAGKSQRNEDQAVCHHDVMICSNSLKVQMNGEDLPTQNAELPWVYFGLFDGHAGPLVAVSAAAELHKVIESRLRPLAPLILALEFDDPEMYIDEGETTTRSPRDVSTKRSNPSKFDSIPEVAEDETETPDKPSEPVAAVDQMDWKDAVESVSDDANGKVVSEKQNIENKEQVEVDKNETPIDGSKKSLRRTMKEALIFSMVGVIKNNITVESLIRGVLESSFLEMDTIIENDKHQYNMPGGCTALVSLFILGKLYVCNAGDTRAIAVIGEETFPMSIDFTPTRDQRRIRHLAFQRPELLGSEFTHLQYIRRPERQDLGKPMLYRDGYMTGWAMKTITYDDLKFPLISDGKRSRLLATISVIRGLGDHELRSLYGSVPIKPFLTPEPEIKILDLTKYSENLTDDDVLIMGTDGLWDVIANEDAGKLLRNSFRENDETRLKYKYITAAQDLVHRARGTTILRSNVWVGNDNEFMASLDDISAFVIPLKAYRDEHESWRSTRSATRHKSEQ